VSGEDKRASLAKLLAADPSIPAGRVEAGSSIVMADRAEASGRLGARDKNYELATAPLVKGENALTRLEWRLGGGAVIKGPGAVGAAWGGDLPPARYLVHLRSLLRISKASPGFKVIFVLWPIDRFFSLR
jgi:hypothetical protein